MKNALLNFFLLICAAAVSYLTAISPVGNWLFQIYSTGDLGDYGLGVVIVMAAYLFWVPIAIISLGKKSISMYIFLLIFYAPVALLYLYASINDRIYIPILVIVAGFAIGYGLRKAKEKFYAKG